MMAVSAQPRIHPHSPLGAFDAASAYLADLRIHVQGGSQFFPSEPHLFVHPAELAPGNLPAFREKLKQILSSDQPYFFADEGRAIIGTALAERAPLPEDAKDAAFSKAIMEWMKEKKLGKDADLAKLAERIERPFASVAEIRGHEKEKDPLALAFQKNAVTLYLLLDESLRRSGHLKPMAEYATDAKTPEGLAYMLLGKVGVDYETYRATLLDKGIDGAARLFTNLDPGYVEEVKRLVEALPDHKFSYNAVANWAAGRDILARKEMETGKELKAGVHELMELGLQARIEKKIKELQPEAEKMGYDVPADAREMERILAGKLRFLPGALTELFFLRGGEVAFTPDGTVKPIAPRMSAYGFHSRSPQHPDDVLYAPRIVLSGKDGEEAMLRTMVHEFHHTLDVGHLAPEEIARVDALAASDQKRLKDLKSVMDRWMARTLSDAETHSMLNQPEFAVNGRNFDQMTAGVDLLTFYHQVEDAHNRLQMDSLMYHNSKAYAAPEPRFLEINSRYSEVRHIRLREHPEAAQFLAPGLTEIYDAMYMPHIEKARDSALAQLSLREVLKAPAIAAPALAHAVTVPGYAPAFPGAATAPGSPAPIAAPMRKAGDVPHSVVEAGDAAVAFSRLHDHSPAAAYMH